MTTPSVLLTSKISQREHKKIKMAAYTRSQKKKKMLHVIVIFNLKRISCGDVKVR